jgi:hypothetical protein
MRTLWYHARRLWWTLHDVLFPKVFTRRWPPGVRLEDPKRREQVTR